MKTTTPLKRKVEEPNEMESPVSGGVQVPLARNQLVSTFSRARERMVEDLVFEIGTDLELMAVVQQTIMEYKSQKSEAEKAGVTVGDMVEAAVAARKRKKNEDDAEDDEGDTAEDNPMLMYTEPLKRHLLVFGNWPARLVDMVLRYLDKACMDGKTVKALDLEQKKEALEMALEIKFFGDELDRIGSPEPNIIFPALKKVYTGLGCRMQYIQVDMEKGRIMWEVCSPWQIIAQEKNQVTVKLMQWATMGPDAILVELSDAHLYDDIGPFTIEFPFSIRQARLKSVSSLETYTLAKMVPQFRRCLAKRPSDVEGATNLLRKSASQAKAESSQAKKEARAKATSGIKVLGDKRGESSKAKAATPALPKAVASKSQSAVPTPSEPTAKQSSVVEQTADGSPPPKATVVVETASSVVEEVAEEKESLPSSPKEEEKEED